MRRFIYAIVFLIPLALLAESENKIPSFSLKDIYREEVVLDSILSEFDVIMISFWAINCKSCIKELTKLEPIYDGYHEQGFEVLAINEDSPRQQAQVKPFVEARKWKYRVLIDEDAHIRNLLKVFVLPTTIIVDKSGDILFYSVGFKDGKENQIQDVLINALLE